MRRRSEWEGAEWGFFPCRGASVMNDDGDVVVDVPCIIERVGGCWNARGDYLLHRDARMHTCEICLDKSNYSFTRYYFQRTL
jgi:hypothetical protein